MLLIVLLASTGCTTMPTAAPDDPYRDILIALVPDTPSPPPFPALQWSYENEKYCISESDADKLLGYGENALPLFRYQIEQFERQVKLILESLRKP